MIYGDETVHRLNNGGYDDFELEEDDLTSGDKANAFLEKHGKPFFKRMLIRIIALIIILVFGIFTFSFVSFCWVDVNRQNAALQGTTNIDGLFYAAGNVDEEALSKMQTFVNDLSPDIKSAIKQDWVFLMAERIPETLFRGAFIRTSDYDTSGMIVAGYTFTQSRLIYINSALSAEEMYNAFVHEIGHLVSFEHGSLHGSAEWERIYETYAPNYDTDSYNLSTEAEFFANAYFEYYEQSEELLAKCEPIYQYMDRLVQMKIADGSFIETFSTGIKNTFNTLRVYYYYYIIER